MAPQSTYMCIYTVQSSVWRLPNYGPSTPSPPSECVLPPHKGGGIHTRRAVRGGGSIFRKTPDNGLASYSIIPLRLAPRVEGNEAAGGQTWQVLLMPEAKYYSFEYLYFNFKHSYLPHVFSLLYTFEVVSTSNVLFWASPHIKENSHNGVQC